MTDNDLPNKKPEETASNTGDKHPFGQIPQIPRLEQGTTQVLPPIMGADAPSGQSEMDDGLEGSDAEAYAALKARRAERRKKKLMRRGIAVGIAVALVGLGALAVNALAPKPDEGTGVVTDFAMRGDYMTTINASGTLEPLSSTVIAPETGGTIAEVKVAAGQQVNKGDVLMTIKNDELDRAVKEAERGLKTAKAALAAAKRGETVTDPETGEQTVEVSQAAIEEASYALEGAQAAYDAAVQAAAARTVTAPSPGSIIAMNAKVGAPVSTAAENGQPLMQIADLSQMKVTIQVSEEDIAKVALDQQATVTFPAFEDLSLAGKVVSIASTATGDGTGMYFDGGASVQFAVNILIEQPDPRLKPGMTASVDLTTEKLEDVIMVPSIALMSDDGENYYVVVERDPETGEHERVDVAVVAQNDDFAVVGRPQDASPESNGEMVTSALTGDEVLVISGANIEGAMDTEMVPDGDMAVK